MHKLLATDSFTGVMVRDRRWQRGTRPLAACPDSRQDCGNSLPELRKTSLPSRASVLERTLTRSSSLWAGALPSADWCWKSTRPLAADAGQPRGRRQTCASAAWGEIFSCPSTQFGDIFAEPFFLLRPNLAPVELTQKKRLGRPRASAAWPPFSKPVAYRPQNEMVPAL